MSPKDEGITKLLLGGYIMEYLGYGMIAMLFIVLFIMAAKDIGLSDTILVFLISGGIFCWFGLASYLIYP